MSKLTTHLKKTSIINFSFLVMELLTAILLGIVVREFSKTYFLNMNFSYVLVVNYLFTTIGIAIPGYYYLKFYGNKKIFIGALFSALTFIFFGFITFIMLGSFGFSIISFEYSGLIIPLIFGVIGFNIFAFRIK